MKDNDVLNLLEEGAIKKSEYISSFSDDFFRIKRPRVGDMVFEESYGIHSRKDFNCEMNYIGFLVGITYDPFKLEKKYQIMTLKDKKIVNWTNADFFTILNHGIHKYPEYISKLKGFYEK